MGKKYYQDTYFKDRKKALETAKKKLKVLAPNKVVEATQLCYYDGDLIEDAPSNCINVKYADFIEYFKNTKYRLPTKIDDKKYIKDFNSKLKIVNKKIDKKIKKIEKKIKEQTSNFKDKKLRIFGYACRETILIKHMVKAIINSAKDLGLEVYIHKQDNDLESCSKLSYLEALYKFNPHITININHMNNTYLNDNVFNFVWFQDPMPFLLDKTKVEIRKRDYVFHLTTSIEWLLKQKNISSTYQPFCIDANIYKKRKEIKKERKIVFVGSSYLNTISFTQEVQKAIKKFKKIFLSGKIITQETANQLALQHKLNIDFVWSRLVPYIIRDIGLLELCKIKSDYKIEIYGWGWEVYEELKPYYKGALKYGQEIADVYSSATFALAPHQQYTLQQRTFEASACGAIPIVYDCREISQEESYEEALYYYKTSDELKKILNGALENKNFDRLLKNHTYSSFVKKIIKVVKENIDG